MDAQTTEEGNPGWGPRTQYLAPIIVSTTIGLLAFVVAWCNALNGQPNLEPGGAGAIIAFSLFAVLGWSIASCVLYALYFGSFSLPPRWAKSARYLLVGDNSPEAPALPAPTVKFQTKIGPWKYLSLTFIELPALTFMAPFLTGFLLAPGYYDTAETIIGASTLVFFVLWTWWIVRRGITQARREKANRLGFA